MSANLNYDITIMMIFSFIGIIIKLFFGNITTTDGSQGPASAALWGYGVVAMSVLVIMFINFALASQMMELNKYSSNTVGFIKALLTSSMPILLTFIILVWLLIINTTYYKRINEGKIANEYNTFSTISTILVVFQLVILFKYLNDEVLAKKGNLIAGVLKGQLASITYILSILNLVFVGMMNIVLEFFSTDG